MLSTTQPRIAQPVTITSTTSPTTTPTQPTEGTPASTSSQSSSLPVNTATHTSSGDPTSLASSTSSSAPSSTWSTASSSWTSLGIQQVTTSSILPSHTRSSSTFSPLATTSTAAAGAIAGATASEKASEQSKRTSRKVGAIVGGTFGGVSFILFGFLAFLFFYRRRRHNQHRRQRSRQSLLRDSGSIISFNDSHHSQPPFPTTRTSSIPFAPVFPFRRPSNPPRVHPDPALAASNQDLSLDRLYLRNENPSADYPFANTERRPVIHISPPSATASTYSRKSWDGGLSLLECYDSSARSSQHENTYYPGGSTSTLSGLASHRTSNVMDLPQTRDSTYSNPFDLEPPPNALQRGPPFRQYPAP